ncbi:MAG: MBOAT family O-acyltransferase [Peptostreptococcales bacterium]
MVFSSLFFLFVFLPVCLILYYFSPNLKIKNIVLVLSSLAFYAWGEPVWVMLLVFSAFIDYNHGRIIEANRGNWKSKAAVVSSLVINLSILGFFKYSGFIVDNINSLLGSHYEIVQFGLPIGISFYTFQTISYVVDVYRGDVESQKKFHKYLIYLSLFTQLVAGPIVRYKDIAEEIENRKLSRKRFNKGVLRFVAGLAKKVMIANTAGQIAGFYLDNSFEGLTILGAWYGISLFSLQIYFDFSGYSDMAIGLGHMLGFTYKENFKYPYISKSATEFWRRWHMSLGSFFRDYIYIPLGGNKRRGIFNLFIVWLLTGLWHGASWNFIFWGLYFGVFIVIEKVILLKLLSKVPTFISHLYLIVVAVSGWVLFYFVDMTQAIAYFRIMIGLSNAPFYTTDMGIRFMNDIYFYIVAILLCTPLVKNFFIRLPHRLFKNKKHCVIGSEIMQALYVGGVIILVCALLVGQSYNPFLYFRF